MQRVALSEGQVGEAAGPAAGPAKLQELGMQDAHVAPEDVGLAIWLVPEAAGFSDRLSLAAAADSACASFGKTRRCHAPISLQVTIRQLLHADCPPCRHFMC